jgi:hypothetical protein
MARTEVFIVNGDSAAGSLGQALGSDQGILVQHDVLSCGPLPLLETVGQWREVREQFWRSILEDLPSPSLAPHDSHDLLSNTDVLRRSELVCLWMGSGSQTSSFPSTAHLLELVGAEPAKLSTVQFSLYPGSPLEIGTACLCLTS